MTQYLILQADDSCGRGARGLNLYRFLSIYHGSRAVRMISTRELLTSPALKTDVLFIGLPSHVRKDHLARVSFREAVLFDYGDSATPNWRNSDRDLLLSLTDRCLKPWVEESWDFGLRLGVLPIRRHFQLTLCLRCRDLFAWPRMSNTGRRYDVAFIGNATALENRFHQRIQWLREIRGAHDEYTFWGGLVARRPLRMSLEQQFGDVGDLVYPRGRVGFLTYFQRLSQSRVALAPAGNARWSYRHYEAIYAGAVPVSADFRQVETLIPLPRETIVHVPDGASVLPAVEEALLLRSRNPEVVQENIRFLERYLHHGDYCRGKSALMEQFLAQLH